MRDTSSFRYYIRNLYKKFPLSEYFEENVFDISCLISELAWHATPIVKNIPRLFDNPTVVLFTYKPHATVDKPYHYLMILPKRIGLSAGGITYLKAYPQIRGNCTKSIIKHKPPRTVL